MEQLVGSQYKSFEQGIRSSKSESPRNVNISMVPSLLQKIDEKVEDSEYSSRSEYVREILKAEVERSD